MKHSLFLKFTDLEELEGNFPPKGEGVQLKNWRGPVEWPARSHDLSPLDYFLRGHLKIKVYSKLERPHRENSK